MNKLIRISAVIITAFITLSVLFAIIQLELFYYSDFGSGCSSGGHGFYLTSSSKITGYILLVLSYLLLLCSIWKLFRFSILWTIPALFVFIIAFYGNGFMLFSTGPCGFSIHKRTAYIFEKHSADIFRSDLYNITELKPADEGKISGFLLKKSILHLYRINADPVKLKTSFLFWHLDQNDINDYFNSFDGISLIQPDSKTVELTGGMNMPLEAFSQNIKQFADIKEQKLVNENNGTTRLILTLK